MKREDIHIERIYFEYNIPGSTWEEASWLLSLSCGSWATSWMREERNPQVPKHLCMHLRADVSKCRPEVYKSEKSKILKKIHQIALGKLLT